MTFEELANVKTKFNDVLGAYTEISAAIVDRRNATEPNSGARYVWPDPPTPDFGYIEAEKQLRKNCEALLKLGFTPAFIDELMDVLYHEGGTFDSEK